jgi:2-dehydro-3-deoxygluconokinase
MHAAGHHLFPANFDSERLAEHRDDRVDRSPWRSYVPIALKPPGESDFDVATLGECMVRLSPPEHGRLEFAPSLEVHVGGGEYNVAYALSRLGLHTAWVGGLVDNPIGDIVANHAHAAGVDTSFAPVFPFDGIGRRVRMGLHFAEVGTGPRASVSIYDRGHSATSQIEPGQVDWNALFAQRGVRWFHTGGIFTCLSESAKQVAEEALRAAKAAGAVVSYDLNFRSKLWDSQAAIAATRPLMSHIDVLIGNEEDFQNVLGYEVAGTDASLQALPVDNYQKMVKQVAGDYPHLSFIGTTLREVVSASENNWSAILYSTDSDTFYEGPTFERLLIEDRVGGGDGFASGLIFAFLAGRSAEDAVALGTAHGALLQTTRGDTSQISLAELEHTAAGGTARIKR